MHNEAKNTQQPAAEGLDAATCSPSDSERLTWLIRSGAYSVIDHDEYAMPLEEIQKEVRRRIDAFIRAESLKSNDKGMAPGSAVPYSESINPADR